MTRSFVKNKKDFDRVDLRSHSLRRTGTLLPLPALYQKVLCQPVPRKPLVASQAALQRRPEESVCTTPC